MIVYLIYILLIMAETVSERLSESLSQMDIISAPNLILPSP